MKPSPTPRIVRSTAASAALLLAAMSAPSSAQIHRVSDEVRRADIARAAKIERHVMVPMRDGVRLATEVYTPRDHDPSQPLPTIFWRTPYNFSPLIGSNPNRPNAMLKYVLDAIERGYAFVVQNERGKFYSDGEWEILGRPKTDGWDALSWIAEQPWSNGRVATLGCSSTAEWQMGLAAMGHPAHAAAVPMGQGAGIGRMGPFVEQGNFYRGGAIQLPMLTWLYGVQNTQRPRLPDGLSREDQLRLARYFDLAPRMPGVDWRQALWHLPVIDIMANAGGPKGVYEELAGRKPGDPVWEEGGLYHDHEGFQVPSLWVNSWYDLSVGPNLALFEHVRANAREDVRDDQFMIVAPTDHCSMYRLRRPHLTGDRDMGVVDFDFDEIVFDFLDHYSRVAELPEEPVDQPTVRYFSMGANEWRTASDWPPNQTTKTLYLTRSGPGQAISLFGSGSLEESSPSSSNSERFTYDPSVPVPTVGGNFCCLGDYQPGALDQRGVEARADVLVFTSEPLTEPLDVAGSVRVVLYVSSDARDTDFTVKLVDVAPDGTAYNLDDSILRMRYREGYDRHVWMADGEVYEVEVGPLSTANVFGVGHRVRLEVSSSNFPRYDRNLNTGGDNVTETEWTVATNRVHHGGATLSRIELPIVTTP